jgi:hypothetical protein
MHSCQNWQLSRFSEVHKMKYAAISAAVIATVILAFYPASARMMMCSDTHLSKMTTMMGGMADGSHKWAMNRHLAMVNAAMAKDGMRGCNRSMMEIMHGSKMPMMKSGM